MPSARPTRFQIARPDILSHFDALGSRVLTRGDLGRILAEQRAFWRLAAGMTVAGFIDEMLAKTPLRKVTLPSEHDYAAQTRYLWRDASPQAVALSLKPRAYLSHASAAFAHNLGDLLPRTIFVNAEQSPKPRPAQAPTQATIDRAFANQPRVSRLSYTHGDWRIVVVQGKNTDRLGVSTTRVDGEDLPVTDLERTLVDLAVRPAYGGGPGRVLDSYRAAVERASVNRIQAILRTLDYAYPYHQAIGFYLQRAGFAAARVEKMKSPGLAFDFHLVHGAGETEYVPEWRLFVPRGFQHP